MPERDRADPKLARELFALVEKDQGFAFISDGIEGLSRKQIFDLANGSLKYSRRVVRKLEQFMLREHAE